MLPAIGRLTDRFGAVRVLTCGFALWSVATALSGPASGLVMLVLLRPVMGMGESVAFPCTLKLLAARVDELYRVRATSITTFGAFIGPAVGTFIGGPMMEQYGWRAMLVGLGASATCFKVAATIRS